MSMLSPSEWAFKNSSNRETFKEMMIEENPFRKLFEYIYYIWRENRLRQKVAAVVPALLIGFHGYYQLF